MAPIKQVQRLKLCGSVILSRLVNMVIPSLEINVTNIYLWADSMNFSVVTITIVALANICVQQNIRNSRGYLTLYLETYFTRTKSNRLPVKRNAIKLLIQTRQRWNEPPWIKHWKSEWHRQLENNLQVHEE